MIGKAVESEHIVSLNEAGRILDERKKEKELTYEQQLAFDHASKFPKLDKSTEEKLKKELVAMALTDKAVFKIIDIMPKNILTLKQILTNENRVFSEEELNKILAAVKASA